MENQLDGNCAGNGTHFDEGDVGILFESLFLGQFVDIAEGTTKFKAT
jgi:hypothetical protein